MGELLKEGRSDVVSRAAAGSVALYLSRLYCLRFYLGLDIGVKRRAANSAIQQLARRRQPQLFAAVAHQVDLRRDRIRRGSLGAETKYGPKGPYSLDVWRRRCPPIVHDWRGFSAWLIGQSTI
ncbi:hypothetical protein [Paraburkholderia sp. MM5384-R2]|uniref:hypothetical protein n=1 Tax=Paraburkholderia sp. MM5384-R2 TaxID=2723097 RepID=UPI00160EC76C|nr:hypothetical protein [Paraburkholderia sp. MM5384-R2]MBB5501570.1 hypothetical protein [Paraburkholderia sp. MM5384-R2]